MKQHHFKIRTFYNYFKEKSIFLLMSSPIIHKNLSELFQSLSSEGTTGLSGNNIHPNIISGFSGFGLSSYYNGNVYTKNKIYTKLMNHKHSSYKTSFDYTETNNIYKKNCIKINKKIKLPKRILDYLEITCQEVTIGELREAIIMKSENNKKKMTFKNPTKSHYQPTTIYLDKAGKDIFHVKVPFVILDCLIDFLLYEYILDAPDSDFYDYNQNPIEVKILNCLDLISMYIPLTYKQ